MFSNCGRTQVARSRNSARAPKEEFEHLCTRALQKGKCKLSVLHYCQLAPRISFRELLKAETTCLFFITELFPSISWNYYLTSASRHHPRMLWPRITYLNSYTGRTISEKLRVTAESLLVPHIQAPLAVGLQGNGCTCSPTFSRGLDPASSRIILEKYVHQAQHRADCGRQLVNKWQRFPASFL